jgi:hypothetical protein
MAALGRKYSVTNGRFQEVKFHRPLSSNEFEEVTVASRLKPAIAIIGKQSLRTCDMKCGARVCRCNVLSM